jgi:hypothetical protein
MTPDHHLFPAERRFAAFVMARQRAHRTSAVIMLEQNYGPDGIALGAAAILLGLAGAVLGCAGIVFCLLQAATTAQRWSDTR